MELKDPVTSQLKGEPSSAQRNSMNGFGLDFASKDYSLIKG